MGRASKPRDLGQELTELNALVRALMTGAMTRPALRVEQGDFPVSGGGSVRVSGGGGITVEDLGSIIAEHANGNAAVYFGRLNPMSTYKSGLMLANEAGTPFAWITTMADGSTAFVSRAASSRITSSYVSIDTPQLELFNLPQVATPTYALGYHYNGTTWSMRLVTSSRKYKADEQPVEIDAERFLQIQPKTWRDKAEVEEDPETTNRHFGVIAEDLVDLGLGDLLVSFVDGEPESVHYPQIAVGLIPIVREAVSTIADQADEIKALREQNAAILKRLDALESAPTKETP